MRRLGATHRIKAAGVTALCLSFVLCPLPRASASAPPKTEAQYKAEAARYDSAVRSVSSIADAKLETADDLRRAVAVIERARPGLRLLLSKVVASALADSAFAAAVRRRASDKPSAETLLKELSADRNAVLRLGGAEQLKTHLLASTEKDSAAFKRAGARLKEAAERVRKSAQGGALREGAAGESAADDKVAFVKAGFAEWARPEPETAAGPAAHREAFTVALIVLGIVIAAEVIVITTVLGVRAAENATSEEGRDDIAECQKTYDRLLARCLADASKLNFVLRPVVEAICYADWLGHIGGCLAV
jgi:hypothetical protein